MGSQHALNFGGVNVLATADNHILDAILDTDEALVVHDGHIASMQPAIFNGLCGGLRTIPVLHHDVLALNQYFASSPTRYFIAIVVGNHYFGVEERLTRGRGVLDGIFGVHQTGGATRFSEAVDLLNTHPHRSEGLHQRRRYGCRSCHHPFQCRIIELLEIGHLQHEVQHGGHC